MEMTLRSATGSVASAYRVHGKTVVAAAATALALGLAVQAQAAGFINGSFEQPGTTPVRDQLADGSTAITGWTNHGAGQYYESNGFDGVDASDGTHWIA